VATRLYHQSTVYTGFTPAVDAAWNLTSGSFQRGLMTTTPAGSSSLNIDFDDTDATNQSIILWQGISLPLTPGQTITGGQALKGQARWRQFDATNNMFAAYTLRVIAADGSTVQKTMLALTLDGIEMFTTALRNRAFTATSAATNYTTVPGDRLVLGAGGSGDPDAGLTHHIRIAIGDGQASDLPEDDTTQTDLRPWFELSDTLTFVTGGSRKVGQGSRIASNTIHGLKVA